MNIVDIKPLSVNQAWQGRRYKTKDYKLYEEQVLLLLPKKLTIPEGRLKITICFGMSNSNSDIDNPTKLFVDILQKKYGFNDNRIYEMNLVKEIVKKGCDFIGFEVLSCGY